MKVVINSVHGGFGLSNEALHRYRQKTNNLNAKDRDIPRDDPDLVQIVETMGDDANARYSVLKVVEIPDGVDWTICDYDGLEWVAEKHRTWS
jgi:hypothetical protein